MLKTQTIVRGAKEIAAKFERAAREEERTIRLSMQKSLRLVQNSAKLHLTGGNPLNVRSGRLRRSVQTDIRGSGRQMEGRVGTNIIYGPVHEYGATIQAKGGYMVFQHKGHWFHVKRVTIPKRPWLEPAFTSNTERINYYFGHDVTGMLQRTGLM